MTSGKPLAPGGLISACYCVGVLLIAISMLDYVATVFPAEVGEPGWRYGAIGLLSGFTLTPLIGGLLLSVAAAVAGHGRTLLALGWLHLLFAVGLVVLLAAFSLDAIQVRRESATEAQTLTEISSLKAAVKLTATLVGLAWIGIAAIRQARVRPAAARPAADSVLIGR
jgi:cytochrome c biogenesis protein CcdA